MSGFNLMTLVILITNRQQSSALSFAGWIFLGLIVGYIASRLLNKTGHGLRRDILIGVVGAIVGGFLSNLFGKDHGPGLDLYSLIVAVVGAAVFMFVFHALFRRRHFLSMR